MKEEKKNKVEVMARRGELCKDGRPRKNRENNVPEYRRKQEITKIENQESNKEETETIDGN